MNNLNIFDKNTSINFEDLYNHQGLLKIDNLFFSFLQEQDNELFNEYSKIKSNRSQYDEKIISDILIEIAKILEKFLAILFDIASENKKINDFHQNLDIIYKVKRDFIQRKVARNFKKDDISEDFCKN